MTLQEVIQVLKDRRRACPKCGPAMLDCIAALEHISGDTDAQLGLFGPVAAKTLTPAERDAWLERIWTIYPKRSDIQKARDALARMQPTEADMEAIWAALQWQVRQRSWLKEGGDYAPAFFRYVQNQKWLDRPPVRPHANKTTIDAVAAVNDFVNEAPCETTKGPGRALPSPSKKSP